MRFAVAVLGGLVWLVVAVGTVFAHAEPANVKPGDGAILVQPPAEVVITMSQELFDRAGANDIDVVDASGVEVTTVSAALDRSDRTKLSVAMPSVLAPGTYSVKWKTLSAEDGDPAEGALSFTYDPNGTASPGKEELREDVLGPGDDGPEDEPAPSLSVGGPDRGVTWVLVIAVGIGMFVLGAGGTFLLVQRQP